MALVVSFPGVEQATLAEVGGKAESLIRMAASGLPVPPGAVLTTKFFAPWFEEVQATATWAALVGAAPDTWGTLCNDLKELCLAVPVTDAQRQALRDLHRCLAASGDEGLFAVRSSSPEEDLVSASFAGGYETRLGVRLVDLEGAVRHCFASSLDERVLVYKREHGFDLLSPSIAVVVQQQIDSEVAGVGFSLNPLTNDYDEVVIDANWGLGDSVVAGLASPDHFIVDKVDGRIVESHRGAKQVSSWLRPDGGTFERRAYRSTELTLTEVRLGELCDLICRAEALYGKPVDLEWAYADAKLYVLQARPITAYVPLPSDMLTPPGARRRLYADAALSKGLTINKPISPLGLDFMEGMFSTILESWAGPSEPNGSPEDALTFFAGGRMYVNVSNVMRLASPKRLAKSAAPTDTLMADILAHVDAKRYRAASRPSWVSLRSLRLVPRVLWRLRGFFWNVLRAVLFPESSHRAFQRRIEAFEAELRESLDDDLPLDELRRTLSVRMAGKMFNVMMPALVVGMVSPDLVVRRKTDEVRALADKLKLGFTGNVVVEMGIALFRLAGLVDRSELEDLPRLARRIESRELSPELLNAWDAFLSKFGCRGPLEMDLASPRYADDPSLALRQMSFMTIDDDGFDPAAAHRRQVEERRQAYEELMRRSGPLRRVLLRRVHRLIDLFAGARDTPKHLIALFGYSVRIRALSVGRRLVREGRLDAIEDVFDLTFRDLELAALDPSLDLREIRRERTHFLKRLDTHVTEFPAVIDSRGRILRPPPRAEEPGELRGMAVSRGVVTGRVKLLRNPYEKSVEKGDVLVAYTTDPGWTPLFVNAAAIVLEVGGVLQHGAVVAREYGKPCVVGIDRLMTRLHDGQTVEVDGTAGVVRVLPAFESDR